MKSMKGQYPFPQMDKDSYPIPGISTDPPAPGSGSREGKVKIIRRKKAKGPR